MIKFENIYTGETVGIDQANDGKYYRAKLSAVMNSSNLNPNADRGQDFGWRLVPEQQATIEEWESNPEMVDKVSSWARVQLDDLTHSEFLGYLLYLQERGVSPERAEVVDHQSSQREYEARVAALKESKVIEPVAPFDPKAVEKPKTTK